MAQGAPKKLIVGLGNPDEQYENTYHNVGQQALGWIAEAPSWEKHRDIFAYFGAKDIIFVRPLTYMNESGKAVREAMKKFGAKPANLVLIQDDSDILMGGYKVSFARNSAGHKGVQSVIDALKTNEFTRIRIGIRPVRERQRQKAGEFALKQISSKDRKTLEGVYAAIKEKILVGT